MRRIKLKMDRNKKNNDVLFIFLISIGIGIILTSLILIIIEINGAKKFCDKIKEPEPFPSLEIFKTGTKISSGPQAVKEFFEKEVKELKNKNNFVIEWSFNPKYFCNGKQIFHFSDGSWGFDKNYTIILEKYLQNR